MALSSELEDEVKNIFADRWSFRDGNVVPTDSSVGLGNEGLPTWITKAVYDRLSDESKFASGKDMWARKVWKTMDDAEVHSSACSWSL